MSAQERKQFVTGIARCTTHFFHTQVALLHTRIWKCYFSNLCLWTKSSSALCSSVIKPGHAASSRPTATRAQPAQQESHSRGLADPRGQHPAEIQTGTHTYTLGMISVYSISIIQHSNCNISSTYFYEPRLKHL